MIQFKQLRPLFDTSSNTWMLLLLSLYFSWICPAEPIAPFSGYSIALVGQKSLEAQGRFYKCNFNASKNYKTKANLPVFSFQEQIDCFQIQVNASWLQCRHRQNLLPASFTLIQFQTHLPRSIAAC